MGTQWLGPQSQLGTTVEVAEIESLAKGTIIAGDGTGAPASVAVGADNTVLTADSSQAAGIKWAAASEMWSLSKTLDMTTAGSTFTMSSITAKNYMMLLIDAEDTNASGDNDIFLRFNGVSSSVYWYSDINGTTLETRGTADVGIRVVRVGPSGRGSAMILFPGKAANSEIVLSVINTGKNGSSIYIPLGARWTSASDVTSITLYSTGSKNFKGKAALYYASDLE